MRSLKRWYYKHEIVALEALAFASRIGGSDPRVSTKKWREWALKFMKQDVFEEVRYTLECCGFVDYYGGVYRLTDEGAAWYFKLMKKRLVG